MSSSLVVSASAAVRASSSVARASASSKASARSNAKPPPTPRAVSSERVVAARAAVLGARVVARRARGAVVASAAADAMGAGAGDAAPDPYKALGVKPGADADEIKKALDRKKLLYKSEPEKLAKMEEAYESIVQASLAARLKGDLSGVDKNILNADAVSLFGPWAPIKCESVMKDKQVNVAIAAAATIITYMTPATVRNLQPIIYATIFMMFRMFAKLADVDPGPSANIDREAAQQHNNKRFFRSFSIVLATFAATLFATYYLPNIIFEMFSISVPVWYLLNQEVIVTAFCSVALAVLTCFYR